MTDDNQQPHANDDPENNHNAPFGLTQPEYEDLKSLLRYAGAIFVAVGMALVIVAGLSALFG
jgi:hypothetical protein